MTDRELFCTMLATLPVERADAVVMLTGEDWKARLELVSNVMSKGGAEYLVLSGGVEEPPIKRGAMSIMDEFIKDGFPPGNLKVDATSQNTKEQAANVVAMAIDRNWTRLMLVASAYHLPRAFLTFLRAIHLAETNISLGRFPDMITRWQGKPLGMEATRAELLTAEFAKIGIYQHKGDVASYREGIEYLRQHEN